MFGLMQDSDAVVSSAFNLLHYHTSCSGLWKIPHCNSENESKTVISMNEIVLTYWILKGPQDHTLRTVLIDGLINVIGFLLFLRC